MRPLSSAPYEGFGIAAPVAVVPPLPRDANAATAGPMEGTGRAQGASNKMLAIPRNISLDRVNGGLL